jgi:hypothetical protein
MIKKILFNILKYVGALFIVITFLLGVMDLLISYGTTTDILISSKYSSDKRFIAGYVNHSWDFYSVSVSSSKNDVIDDKDEYEVYGGTECPNIELEWINHKHLHITIDYAQGVYEKRNELEKRSILEREYYKNKWINPRNAEDVIEITYTRKNLSAELEKEFPIKFTDSPYIKRPTFELIKDFWAEMFKVAKNLL